MSKCINKSHPEFKQLLLDTEVNPFIVAAKVGIWMEQNNTELFPTIDQLGIKKGPDTSRIIAQLKIIDVLPKLNRGILKKGKEQGWVNDLQKQGVPAYQLAMFAEVAEPGMTKDDITVAIAAKNTFTVETNLSIENNIIESVEDNNELGTFTLDGVEYQLSTGSFNGNVFLKGNERITRKEYAEAAEKAGVEIFESGTPTDFYDSLTVPGGTNYTETEIATPEIIPTVKGHAQFSTDKGIGWFRSDVQRKPFKKIITTKTRRILEFQSDLFQKRRGATNLTTTDLRDLSEKDVNSVLEKYKKQLIQEYLKQENKVGKKLAVEKLRIRDNNLGQNDRIQIVGRIDEKNSDKFSETAMYLNLDFSDYEQAKGFQEKYGINKNLKEKIYNDFYKALNESFGRGNEFLAFLNKKNNWVNFFIKSIIQDSARKGYEKVLFPSGETAARVEGHDTLADEIEARNRQLSDLEEQIKKATPDNISNLEAEAKELRKEYDKILAARIEEITKINNGIIKDYLKPITDRDIQMIKRVGEAFIQQAAFNTYEYDFNKLNHTDDIRGTNFEKTFKLEKYDGFFVYSYTKEPGSEEWIDKVQKVNSKDLARVLATEKAHSNGELELLRGGEFSDFMGQITKKKAEIRVLKNTLQNIPGIKEEIEELKGEIQEYKTTGIEQLRPIEGFYEERVTNILKKQGYNPKRITDEHGNTWNEITIEKARDKSPILYQAGPSRGRAVIQEARDIFFNEVYQRDLSETDVRRINTKLRQISDRIGDQPWRLKEKFDGTYYIAGYKNANVAQKEDTYYSPYANGMFRQMSVKNTEKANAKLDRILGAWARKHGVAIESLKSVMEKFPNRFEENALGVADFMNSLIAIADGAKIDTLAEEVAHFAIEMQLMSQGEANYILGPTTVKQALEQVTETETYAQVKEEYKDIYENEEDFRKEALGKILAAEIVNQFKQTDQFIEEDVSGFWQSLKKVWQDFTAWLDWALGIDSAGRNDIENVVIPLARDILNLEQVGKYEKFESYKQLKKHEGKRPFTKDDIKYQKEKKSDERKLTEKEKFLKKVEQQLLKKKQRLKEAQRDTRSQKSKKAIAAVTAEIEGLQRDLENARYNTGITKWIYSSKEEVYEIFKVLDSAERGDVTLGGRTLYNYELFLDSYNSLINTLIEDVRVSTVTREEGADIEEAVASLRDLITKSRTRLKPLRLEKNKEKFREINRTPDGEVIDKDFDEESAFEAMQTKFFDWFKYYTGNFKNAKSAVIRSVHKFIYDAYNNVKRFAVSTARDVLASQTLFLSKYKQEDLIEMDGNKPTHYMVAEYNYSKFYKEREKFRKKVAEKLGYIDPETGEGDPSLINKNFFTAEQAAAYAKMWEGWYIKNAVSIKVDAKKDIIEDGNLVTQVLMKLRNSNRDPIWVNESDVAEKKKQGYYIRQEYKQVPNDSYKNNNFAKLMKDEKFRLHYETLMRVKREALAKLPAGFQTDQLLHMRPSMMKSTLDRLFRADGNILTRIKEVAREGVMIEQDDTQFGELRELDKETVPIYFTRELDDPSKLTTDFGRAFVMFAEMAENFYQMTKISPDVNNILFSLKDKEYYSVRRGNIKEKVASEASMEYATVKEMIDSLVYGQQRQTAEYTIPGTNKTVSLTKLTSGIASYIRNNNLAFNVPTSLAGYIKGSIDSIIEGSTGLYITAESKNWSRIEFLKEIGTVIGEIGSNKQSSKMHLLNQDMGVVTLDSMLYETDKSRLTRKLASGDLMYVTYATGDYGLKSRISLGVYDNYRLYDGNFITKEQFLRKTAAKKGVEYGKSRKADKAHEKSVQKEWEALREKSLYNAYEVVNNKLRIKKGMKQYINDGLLNAVKGKIEYVSNNIDGLLGATDKGKLARTSAGDFLLMHRGWFVNLIDAKMQTQKTSWITGEEEIGHYRAFFGQYLPSVFKGMKGGDLMAAHSVYDGMTKAQRRGVKKSVIDMFAAILVSFLAGLAQKFADEDDEDRFVIQFTSLIMNRVLMEQSAPWSPATLTDLIDEPVVGTKMLKGWTDLTDLFDGTAIESGPYEGQSRRSKWVQKKIPFGWKNIYEFQYPGEKNKFYKQLVGDGFFANVLSSDPEKQYSLIKWLKQTLGPSPVRDWDAYTEEERSDILLQGIEELENEQDMYNGWN